PLLLLQPVQDRVPGHDQVSAVRDEQPVDRYATGFDLLHLLEQDPRVQDHAVADDAGGVGVEDSGRDQVETEFLAGADHGVPGVDQLGDVAPVLGQVVVVEAVSVDEEDDVRVLLYTSAFAKVGELGTMIGALLGLAAQLGAGDDGNVELAGQAFEGPGDVGD